MTVWAKWSEEEQVFLFSDSDNGGLEISQQEHEALMLGLGSGQLIVADEHGAPVLVDSPAPPVPAIWAKWVEQDRRFLFLDRDNGGVMITLEAHSALLEAQATGLRIVADAQGLPVLAEPLAATVEELESAERTWRDLQLSLSDGVVTRHRDELEEGIAATLTAEQYSALQGYRRQLRDWPQGADFPLEDHRPVAPPWIAEQTE